MAKKRQTKQVGLRFPPQYIWSLMANRFALQREDGFVLVHFGLVEKSGSLIDHFGCLIADYTLEGQKENLLQYSDTVGTPKNEWPTWQPPKQKVSELTPVVDFIHLTNWLDRYAEICFMNYSQAQLADATKTGESSLGAWGVALIRCGLDLQRAFLQSLYET